MNSLKHTLGMAGLLTLAACATGPVSSQTSASGLSAGSMHLDARMSASIFLQPVSPREYHSPKPDQAIWYR